MVDDDESLKYTAQPWSCRDFDERECQQKILHNLQEQYNTIYDCAFVQPEQCGGQEGLLLAACHSGDVRLYNWRHVCSAWLGGRRGGQQQQQHQQQQGGSQQPGQQQELLSWRAHAGPVYALALLQHEGAHLLATAGGDGHAKLWRLADVAAAAAAADAAASEAAAAAAAAAGGGGGACAVNGGAAPALRAAAEVLLPAVLNPLGIVAAGGQPAAQALAVDAAQQQVFIGSSDGGVHAWRLSQLAAAAAALGGGAGRPPPAAAAAAAAAALSLAPMPGHAAAVLGLDYCPAKNQLASASEDGTVRVWDAASLACLSAINPWQEQALPLDEPAEVLRGAQSPGCTCVRFDDGGNWLLAGHADGSLTLWNCLLGSAARHKACRSADGGPKAVPQVLLVTPGVTYVGGTDARLYQFTFNLELLHSFDVGGPESVFGVALDAASGVLAVCGSRGCVALVGTDGQALGWVRPPPSALMPPAHLQGKQQAAAAKAAGGAAAAGG